MPPAGSSSSGRTGSGCPLRSSRAISCTRVSPGPPNRPVPALDQPLEAVRPAGSPGPRVAARAERSVSGLGLRQMLQYGKA
jgi:hypothetical protein